MKKTVLLFLLLPTFIFSQSLIHNIVFGDPNIASFGASVAISSDGTFIAVGAPGTGNDSYVRVYKNENNSWTQVGTDILNVEILERVGSSIAISDDGSIVAIGARQAGNLDNGHVRIYKNDNNVWTQIGTDIIGEASFDEAGRSIALSSDGSIVAIGSPLNDVNGSKSGQVRVYRNDNNVWTQLGADINGDASGNEFGRSVSISSNGTIVAIGSSLHDATKGQVKIFKYENNVWTQLGANINGEVGGDYLGFDVSLSNNGNTLATFDARGNNANPQHLRVFKYENNSWISKGNPISINRTNSFEGSVSISGDGTVVAFGQKSNKKAIIFEYQNNDWVKKGNDISFNSGGYAENVALSDNGKFVIIGWPLADHSGKNNNGAVEVFDLTSVLSVDSFISPNVKIYPNPVSNILNISSTNNTQLNNISIYNTIGKKILSTKNTIIDISSLDKGIYILDINTSKGRIFKKIFKN